MGKKLNRTSIYKESVSVKFSHILVRGIRPQTSARAVEGRCAHQWNQLVLKVVDARGVQLLDVRLKFLLYFVFFYYRLVKKRMNSLFIILKFILFIALFLFVNSPPLRCAGKCAGPAGRGRRRRKCSGSATSWRKSCSARFEPSSPWPAFWASDRPCFFEAIQKCNKKFI